MRGYDNSEIWRFESRLSTFKDALKYVLESIESDVNIEKLLELKQVCEEDKIKHFIFANEIMVNYQSGPERFDLKNIG